MSISGMTLNETGYSGTGITSASRNLAVKLESEGVFALADEEPAIGIINGDPLNGVVDVVRLGKTRAISGGNITAGHYVTCGADGVLVDAGALGAIAATTFVVGQALESAVSGQVFTVWVQPTEITKPAA